MTHTWVRERLSLLKETVLPLQTISGLGWFFAALFSTPLGVPSQLFMDWSIIPAVIALVSARCSGMCWNRLVDAAIDAQNPRTQSRAIPSGRAAPEEIAMYALFFLASFLMSCFFFSKPCRILALVVSVLILFYSFAKRLTVSCHFILGAIYACIPLAVSLWVEDSIPMLIGCLAIAAFCSVAATDIIYSIQDQSFDKKLGLHSIPARFGTEIALQCALGLSLITLFAVSYGLYSLHITPCAWTVWGGAVVASIWILRQMWQAPIGAFHSYFSLFLSLHSTAVFVTLLVDRACIVLMP